MLAPAKINSSAGPRSIRDCISAAIAEGIGTEAFSPARLKAAAILLE